MESELYEVLARYASDVVVILDVDARVKYLSPSAERLMGYRAADWMGQNAFPVIHPDDMEIAAGAFARAIEMPGFNEPIELRILRVGGGSRWFEIVATNLLDHPAIQGIVLCGRDITERVEAYEAVRRNDDRLNALLRRSSDVVVVITADGNLSYVSPSAPQLLGYPHGTHLGARIADLVHPEDRDRVRDAILGAQQSGEQQVTVEMRLAHADGSWRDVELVASDGIDDPSVGGVVCNLRDVTDLRAAQHDIAASARRFEAMLANLTDMVSVIDAKGKMSYVSPAAEVLHGRRAADRIGGNIFEFIHPDDTKCAAARLRQALANPGLLPPFEARVRHEDGTYRTFEVKANNLLDDPAVNGIIVNSRDITERVEAERALRDNERHYRTIVETANEGIWIIDSEAVTTFVNRRMSELLGVSPVDMIGRHINDFLDDDGRNVATGNLERRRAGIAGQYDMRLRRADGTFFWAMISASPLDSDGGPYHGSIALVTDVTDRRDAEAQLRAAELDRHRHKAELDRHRLEAELDQARRLESLGRLSAGVAHDFNNLIGVILNHASVAARNLEDTDTVGQDLAYIQRAAEQAADVTRKLLIFGKADRVQPEVFDLNDLIEDVAQLVEGSFGRDITIQRELCTDHCRVKADRGQFEQLLMNLLVNARDALPHGGNIRVTTGHDTDRIQPGARTEPIVLTVADDGTGMTQSVQHRAFEPFFTTKSADNGSGLGLATVHAIVDRADGHITIASAPSSGTTIRIELPSAEAVAPT
jgi:PAS domain S-box-containing protein